jgi:hypothetical protein
MNRLALAALAALLFSTAPLAQDKSVSADEIQIKQLERAWNQAEAKQEVKEVSALLADTLAYTDYDGSFMNKAEYMKWVAAPEQKADHLYDEGSNVKVYGDAAVVTGIYLRDRHQQRQTLCDPLALHGHVDQTQWCVALCGQPQHAHPKMIRGVYFANRRTLKEIGRY